VLKAAQGLLAARHHSQPFDPAANWFVFSTNQIAAHLAKLPAADRKDLLQKALTEAVEIANLGTEAA